MKIVLPVVGIAVLVYAGWAAFLKEPPTPRPPSLSHLFDTPGAGPPLVRPGESPWKANELFAESSRSNARNMLRGTLERPTASFCTGEGRSALKWALDYYYDERGLQHEVYKTRGGDAGAAFIAQAWSTSDDNRVLRLTGETYRNGYFDPAKLKKRARETIAEVLRGEKPAPNPC